jgi:anti-sigma factor RsiW
MEGQDMNDREFNQLCEAAISRPLTAEEEARVRTFLAAHPEARPVWEEEAELTRLLNQLPNAPLASNFTAQVMRAVERESPGRSRTPRVLRWLRLTRPAQRFAAACLLIVLATFSYSQYQAFSRQRMAASLAAVADTVDATSEVAPLPAVEMLKDFDAIYLLGRTRPQADEELLAALNQVPTK